MKTSAFLIKAQSRVAIDAWDVPAKRNTPDCVNSFSVAPETNVGVEVEERALEGPCFSSNSPSRVRD